MLLPDVTVVAPAVSGHSVIEASDAARSCCVVSAWPAAGFVAATEKALSVPVSVPVSCSL